MRSAFPCPWPWGTMCEAQNRDCLWRNGSGDRDKFKEYPEGTPMCRVWEMVMSSSKTHWSWLIGTCLWTVMLANIPAGAQVQRQANIVVIMGDDIGMWNIGAYHRGLMAG